MRDHTEINNLFNAVQNTQVFADSKTFCDCIPKDELFAIQEKYDAQKGQANFNLKQFVLTHFNLPEKFASNIVADKTAKVEEHIEKLWSVLLRKADADKGGTLLPLPQNYIVPGGRFGEIYYWDSYFTMLGLKEAGKIDLIEQMVQNFAHLIDTVGYIPNGNRTYYIGRSQPPFFALMVKLLADCKGAAILVQYLPSLEKEYCYWMLGDLVVQLGTGRLNRYWDAHATPRPEAYKEDMELAATSSQAPEQIYRNIRAAAASGWDFSTRWFKEADQFSTIHTTAIVPVDLNALMYLFEEILEQAYNIKGDAQKATQIKLAKEQRKELLLKYCWNEKENTFCDFNSAEDKPKQIISLAMMYPLYAKMANKVQAQKVVQCLENNLLFEGGVATTTNTSGQQWDCPNGWAPLQWITVVGLQNYGYHELAHTIMDRWVLLNRKVFARTGKMMEKYNVVDTALEAGGGEYEGQDGFGWTNGVFLAMCAKQKMK